ARGFVRGDRLLRRPRAALRRRHQLLRRGAVPPDRGRPRGDVGRRRHPDRELRRPAPGVHEADVDHARRARHAPPHGGGHPLSYPSTSAMLVMWLSGRRCTAPSLPRPSTTPPPTLTGASTRSPRTPCRSTNPIHTMRRSTTAERSRSTVDPFANASAPRRIPA